MKTLVLSLSLAGALMAGGLQNRTQLHGDYIEARTADVYTGPCFANSEVDLVGKLAVFGWRVDSGEFQGVKLDGLSVVGVVRANNTLGDPNGNPYPVKSVVIVDQKANPEQRLALGRLPSVWAAICCRMWSGLNISRWISRSRTTMFTAQRPL